MDDIKPCLKKCGDITAFDIAKQLRCGFIFNDDFSIKEDPDRPKPPPEPKPQPPSSYGRQKSSYGYGPSYGK
ncbi:hypothetical protein HIM_02917 [Hirsutella minnesotensis 3608]|nr:hypothetical protein HIM_02917 [Hirsutella minnesotensis 3608]